MRTAAAAGLSVLLLAGCGGPARQAATTRPGATAGARLQGYLDAMRSRERRFEALSQRVVAAVGALDVSRPGPSWRRASRTLAPVSTGFDRLGADISKVQPPARLAEVHARLAEATVAFSGFVFNLQQALASELPTALVDAAGADTSAIKQARRDWSTAVKRYAARLGVLPPEWLAPSPPG